MRTSPLYLIRVELRQKKNNKKKKVSAEICRTDKCDSLVTATWRFTLPSSITSITSSGLVTNRSVQPLLKTKQKHSVIPRKRKQTSVPKCINLRKPFHICTFPAGYGCKSVQICIYMPAIICNSETQSQSELGLTADDSPSHRVLCICLHALTDWFLSLWRMRGEKVRYPVCK